MLKYYTLLIVALLGLVSESQAALPFNYYSLNDGPSVLTATQVLQSVADAAAVSQAPAAEPRVDESVNREVPKSDAAPVAAEQAPVQQGPVPTVQPVVPSPIAVEGQAVAGEPVAGQSVETGQAESAMQSAPVYRSARGYRPKFGGVLGELIELERKKHAWIRRNVFGR